MRKVDLKQGSPEWLEWRKNRITATEAPVLMGASPFVTPYKGWQRKVGLSPEPQVNAHMLRGQRDEPIARELFIIEYDIPVEPCCIESEKHDFLGASLDGLSLCGKYLIEIKSQRTPSTIPEYHYMQMQHQMLCSDQLIEKAFYVSHWDGVNTTFEVFPDLDWMKDYIEKARAYWKSIIFHEPPVLSPKDYTDKSSHRKWVDIAGKYQQVCREIQQLEQQKEDYRKQLIDLCQDENCMGHGVRVLKKMSKGRIDYEQMAERLNISEATINQYRRPSSPTWTVMLEKN